MSPSFITRKRHQTRDGSVCRAGACGLGSGSSHPNRSPPCRHILANGERNSGRSGNWVSCAEPRLGLGAWELGGDALGLLQNRVEVLCLDQFVGLQVLEDPGAAHRQAGRGRRPGIGEIHDDEPVVLTEHQVVGLKLAPADSTALDTTMTRSLGWSMARAMASPLRVKNTAYFDIAATPPPTDTWDSCRPAGWRLGAHHSTDKRPEPGAGCQDPQADQDTPCHVAVDGWDRGLCPVLHCA